jgi:hypothetical protein
LQITIRIQKQRHLHHDPHPKDKDTWTMAHGILIMISY